MKSKTEIIPLINVPFMKKLDDLSSSLHIYNDELVIIEYDQRNGNMNYVGSVPVEIDDLLVIMVLQGECTIHINYIPYRLHKNMFVVLRKKLLISKTVFSDDFRGYQLVVQRDLMRTALENHVFPTKEIFSRRTILPVIEAKEEDFVRLEEFIRQLIRNISLHTHLYQRTLIRNSLCNIHVELWNMTAHVTEEELSHGSQPSVQEKLTLDFIHAVHTECKKKHEVSDYADDLNVSSTYLTRVVKNVTGKTGSEWINEALVNEAKLLLHKPEVTMQTIAAELNFSEQSAFSKFFKKNTGMTPQGYKNRVFGAGDSDTAHKSVEESFGELREKTGFKILIHT